MGKPFYIFVCCILSFSAFVQSQSFNDTIFTKDNDTIFCQITLVNEHNIFYNYKKKKRSKATDIPQDQVLTYKSDNPKLLELINRPRFLKCDTCENWLAFKSGDTAYYGITPLYFNHEKKLLFNLMFKTDHSSTLVNLANVNAIYFDGLYYQSIRLSKLERSVIFKNSKALRIRQEDFLSYKIIDGIKPLNIFSYYVNTNENVLFEGVSYVIFNPIIVGTIVESTKKNRFKFAYFIENDNKRIVIPNSEDAFIDFIVANLSDRPDIVIKVKNKEYQYSDIEEIFRDYNKK